MEEQRQPRSLGWLDAIMLGTAVTAVLGFIAAVVGATALIGVALIPGVVFLPRPEPAPFPEPAQIVEPDLGDTGLDLIDPNRPERDRSARPPRPVIDPRGVLCNDGSRSPSCGVCTRGCCSGHGGCR